MMLNSSTLIQLRDVIMFFFCAKGCYYVNEANIERRVFYHFLLHHLKCSSSHSPPGEIIRLAPYIFSQGPRSNQIIPKDVLNCRIQN
jgi:hypothetical protein